MTQRGSSWFSTRLRVIVLATVGLMAVLVLSAAVGSMTDRIGVARGGDTSPTGRDPVARPPIASASTTNTPESPFADPSNIQRTTDAKTRATVAAFLQRIGKQPSEVTRSWGRTISMNGPALPVEMVRTADMFMVLVYTDEQGKQRVVEYVPSGWQEGEPRPATPGTGNMTVEERLSAARALVLAESGVTAEYLDGLEHQTNSKGPNNLFMRWTHTNWTRPSHGIGMAPRAQVGMSTDGTVFNYLNYLGLLPH